MAGGKGELFINFSKAAGAEGRVAGSDDARVTIKEVEAEDSLVDSGSPTRHLEQPDERAERKLGDVFVVSRANAQVMRCIKHLS